MIRALNVVNPPEHSVAGPNSCVRVSYSAWSGRAGELITPPLSSTFNDPNLLFKQGRVMRRTIMRYVCLCITMVFTNISPRVKKRFPSLNHYVEAGLLNDNELEIIQDLNQKFPKHSKHWWVTGATEHLRRCWLMWKILQASDCVGGKHHHQSTKGRENSWWFRCEDNHRWVEQVPWTVWSFNCLRHDFDSFGELYCKFVTDKFRLINRFDPW
jgi:hypothetical protein